MDKNQKTGWQKCEQSDALPNIPQVNNLKLCYVARLCMMLSVRQHYKLKIKQMRWKAIKICILDDYDDDTNMKIMDTFISSVVSTAVIVKTVIF
jgi:hypothetical protein